MSFKTLIFFGLLAVTLGFTLPEESSQTAEMEMVNGDEISVQDDYELVLMRKARSPQGYMSGTFEHSHGMGSSASIDYSHQLRKNLAMYGGAARNFKYNDNSAHVGLIYTF